MHSCPSFVPSRGPLVFRSRPGDISLAGRILAAFADVLDDPAISDDLGELGRLVERPEANIIKLPNISASVPQMKECIAELQARGFALPDYPDDPNTDEDRATRARYDRAKGKRGQPGAPPGQLRSSGPQVREGVRDGEPATDAGMAEGLEDARGHHVGRRLPEQ